MGGGCCDCLDFGFILNCGYDQAGDLLKFVLPGPALSPAGRQHVYNFRTISQRAYAPPGVAWDTVQMYDDAYVYLPTGCWGANMKTCRLHVDYHGCGGGGTFPYPDHFGLANWAESNDITIVYPQASAGPGNLAGCWDWWGVTSSDFDTHKGLQLNV